MSLPIVQLLLMAQSHRHDPGTVGELSRGLIRTIAELNIMTGELLEAAAEDIDSSVWEVLGRIECRKRTELS